MRKIVFAFILLNSVISYSQSNLDRFTQIVEKGKMNFVNATKLVEVPIDSTARIKYDYALKYLDHDFIILYSVKPYDPESNEEKYISKDEDGNLMDQHIARFQQIVFDIFADEYFDYRVFDSLAVKQEFNADWGASTTFTLHPKSFQGKKYCTTVALHKEKGADVLIYFISDTKELFNEHLTTVFYNLKFD